MAAAGEEEAPGAGAVIPGVELLVRSLYVSLLGDSAALRTRVQWLQSEVRGGAGVELRRYSFLITKKTMSRVAVPGHCQRVGRPYGELHHG